MFKFLSDLIGSFNQCTPQVEYIVPGTPVYYNIPKYRIAPSDNMDFLVEKLDYNGYWKAVKETIYEKSPYPSCYETPYRFKTEHEAETFVKKELDRHQRLYDEAKKVAEFKEAHPPREIPPYKFLK